MTHTRLNLTRVIAPLTLMCALAVTGCAAGSDAPAASDAPVAVAAGTGVTSVEDLRWGSIDSPDEAFNDAIGELAVALNVGASEGLLEININAHNPSLVGINILTDSEDGTVSEEQLRSVIDALVAAAPDADVQRYDLGGFNRNFGRGDVMAAAAAIGVNPEFLVEMNQKVEIPGDQLANVYA